MSLSLYDVFAAAADGKLPAQDGQVEVIGDACAKAAAVIAFPAHFYMVAPARAHGRGDDLGLREVAGGAHPRVERARRYRDDVRVWETSDGAGCLVLGRGVAGRWEAAFEVEPAARGRGLGRGLAAAALGLLPPDTPVFAQVSPGNSISLRATLAAGFAPIGAEVLLTRTRDR
jgi:GNAT superfamily N-acetyltransferase